MILQTFADHWVGNLVIIAVFGLATLACFVAAAIMLLRPGERRKNHPKYLILNDDR